MEEWTIEQFQEAMRKSQEERKKLPQEKWDSQTRAARIAKCRMSYFSPRERLANLLEFKKEVDPQNEQFIFFWATKSPFSQWYKCSFKTSFISVEDPINKSDNDEHVFSSAEQYMMYAKAMLFLDRDTALQILSTDDVRKIKELGRKVKYFDEIVWDFNKVSIVYWGNKMKFTQNKNLMQALFDTQGYSLVEAAPNDKVWGIGLTEDDVMAKKRETWQGENLLGEILTQLRFELMEKY